MRRKRYVGIHVKYPSLLSDLNHNCNVLTNVTKTHHYHHNIRQHLDLLLHAETLTDRHGEVNRRIKKNISLSKRQKWHINRKREAVKWELLHFASSHDLHTSHTISSGECRIQQSSYINEHKSTSLFFQLITCNGSNIHTREMRLSWRWIRR
jgi:hypothetical protein